MGADLDCKDRPRRQRDQSLRRRSLGISLPCLILAEQITFKHITLSYSKWLAFFTESNFHITLDSIQWFHKTGYLWLLNICLFQMFSNNQFDLCSSVSKFDGEKVCQDLSASSARSGHGSVRTHHVDRLIRSWLPRCSNPIIITMTSWCILYDHLAR